MTLHGADDFRRRLRAIADSGEGLAERWAEDSIERMRSEINHRTGQTGASLQVGSASNSGASVLGSRVITYLAGGTRAHEQRPRRAKAMKFEIGARTIFTKRVQHPATAGNPDLANAPREALEDLDFADEVIGRWNGAA